MEWAQKCSAIMIDGEWHDVFKDPITAPGKKSKKGRLGLEIQCGIGSCSYVTKRIEHIHGTDMLATVWEDGVLVRKTTFEEVRNRAADWVNAAVPEIYVKAA